MSQNSSNVVMPALAAATVVAAVIGAVLWLGRGDAPSADQAAGQAPLPQLEAGEAPDIQAVDISDGTIAAIPQVASATPGQNAAPADGGDLFASSGRRRELRDGLTSDTALPAATQAPESAAAGGPLRIIDFFDYGQLDQRLRIGIFGRSSIPQYRVRHSGQRYVIDMPGQYRLTDGALNRRLDINALGIRSAELLATDGGIRMVIETQPNPRHAGFLIEDPRGIMIAFEPRP